MVRNVRRRFVALLGVLLGGTFTVAACDLALGLGDLHERELDGSSRDLDGAPGIGDADAAHAEAGPWPAATSCEGTSGPGSSDCGAGRNESCCSTSEVVGGSYARANNATYPASVSGFRLDRFEVTVGRLRPFVDAVVAGGYRPASGSGKHVHLNDGRGLVLVNGGYEIGWMTDWNDYLPTTMDKWLQDLSCGSNRTWIDASDAGAGDARPANCLSWYEAYAFCIWDGGFLPSDSEWGYAASGGAEQRKYPWSNPPVSTDVGCSFATIDGCVDAGPRDVGATSPKGDGRWGQADLGGNVHEWNLDSYDSDYAIPCADCADMSNASSRVSRGGAFNSASSDVLTSARRSDLAVWHNEAVGVRCARPL